MNNFAKQAGSVSLGDGGVPKKKYSAPRVVVLGSVRSATLGSKEVGADGAGSKGGKNNQSDLILKTNIQQVGRHPLGFGLYLFDFKAEFQEAFGAGRQFGVIAQEVLPVVPDAVSRDPGGYLVVDYDLLGIDRHMH